MGYSIVIPVTDCKGDSSRKDLENLIESIQPQLWDKVIACMDGVEWGFISYFNDKYPWIEYLWNQGKPFNFTKNANLGLKHFIEQTQSDGAFLINQDCVLGHNELLHQIANDGISTPKATSEFYDVDCIDHQPQRLRITDRHFAFYCPYISRKTIEEIGYLDEVMVKVFSDNDYILRALLKGLTVETTNVSIYHKGSFVDLKKQEDRSGSGCYGLEDLTLAQLQFKQKWNSLHLKDEEVIPYVLSNFTWADHMKCETSI